MINHWIEPRRHCTTEGRALSGVARWGGQIDNDMNLNNEENTVSFPRWVEHCLILVKANVFDIWRPYRRLSAPRPSVKLQTNPTSWARSTFEGCTITHDSKRGMGRPSGVRWDVGPLGGSEINDQKPSNFFFERVHLEETVLQRPDQSWMPIEKVS